MKDKTYTVRWTEVMERSERFIDAGSALLHAAKVARETYGGVTVHDPDGKIMLLRAEGK